MKTELLIFVSNVKFILPLKIRLFFAKFYLGEIVTYDVKFRRGNPSCHANKADTCERALCDCDNFFASSISDVIEYYTDDYHLYWTPATVSWKPDEKLVKILNIFFTSLRIKIQNKALSYLALKLNLISIPQGIIEIFNHFDYSSSINYLSQFVVTFSRLNMLR